MKIKVIIFDFAGVLTTAKGYFFLSKNLSKRFSVDESLIKERLYANEKLSLLGEDSTEDFWEKALKDLGIPFKAFAEEFASCYELNPGVLDLAKALKKSFRIIVFSDNFDAVTPSIRKEPVLQDLFEEMFFSNEMHLVKAQEESFKYILQKLGVKPEECIFIDDAPKSMISPNKLGIRTILFKNVKQVKEDLKKLGIRV